ncbi:MFS transporter [Rudaeicoccus suwonensis]|uniref:MFS transporter n=1 Tax=Rudaeicoccus suwonensis TaxID=657409 RepID=A0A561E3Q6_9MICO|nr:MFS transporter [Rudaeicoccus suwonensis]TWE10221.1 MFS transporter [Rudaeicoccus suwonensis]
MTGTTRVGSYRNLLTQPGVPRVMALADLGRLGYAMLPLLFLFTIADGSSSFTTAATAMAGFGFASFTMPAKGHLIDRFGQPRSLTAMAALSGAALLTVAVIDITKTSTPPVVWIVLAVVVGLCAPPLGPSVRAQWRRIAPDHLDSAYALDATIEELLWLLGPALAGVLISTAPPAVGLLLVPPVLMIGAIGLATSQWRPPQQRMNPAESSASNTRPVAMNRRLWPVLITMLGTGLGGSLLIIGIAAAANHRGHRVLAAVADVALGVGGVVGGVVWGKLRRTARAGRSMKVLLLISGSAALLVAVFKDSPVTVAALILAGAASAPIWVVAYQAADDAVATAKRTEASTWVTTIANLGTSAGTAVGGFVSARTNFTFTLLMPAGVMTLTAVVTSIMWTRVSSTNSSPQQTGQNEVVHEMPK